MQGSRKSVQMHATACSQTYKQQKLRTWTLNKSKHNGKHKRHSIKSYN